jgi:hypothetical protein
MNRGLAEFRDDNRGALAFHIVIMFGGLAMAGVLFILLDPIVQQFLNLAASKTTSQAATEGQNYVVQAWSNAHFIVIGLSVLQLIVAAVYEAEVSR